MRHGDRFVPRQLKMTVIQPAFVLLGMILKASLPLEPKHPAASSQAVTCSCAALGLQTLCTQVAAPP